MWMGNWMGIKLILAARKSLYVNHYSASGKGGLHSGLVGSQFEVYERGVGSAMFATTTFWPSIFPAGRPCSRSGLSLWVFYACWELPMTRDPSLGRRTDIQLPSHGNGLVLVEARRPLGCRNAFCFPLWSVRVVGIQSGHAYCLLLWCHSSRCISAHELIPNTRWDGQSIYAGTGLVAFFFFLLLLYTVQTWAACRFWTQSVGRTLLPLVDLALHMLERFSTTGLSGSNRVHFPSCVAGHLNASTNDCRSPFSLPISM